MNLILFIYYKKKYKKNPFPLRLFLIGNTLTWQHHLLLLICLNISGPKKKKLKQNILKVFLQCELIYKIIQNFKLVLVLNRLCYVNSIDPGL